MTEVRTQPSKGRARLALFYAVLLALPFLAVEGMVRVIHELVPLYEDKTSRYVDHPLYHHWHVPGATGTSRTYTGEYAVPYRTNSHGMPGKEVAHEKPPGAIRIAILGDSFVEGFTTVEEKSIPAQAEDLLNRTRDGRYEVLNFGCTSYSPSVEYFVVTRLASQFDPDVVVLLFHFTDVTNDWNYKSCWVYGEDGSVVAIDGRRQKSLLYRTAEHSALLRVIVQKVKAMRKASALRRAANLTDTFDVMFKASYSDQDLEAWRNSIDWLSRIREWCAERSVPFVLAAIPVGTQLEPVASNAKQRFQFLADGKLLRSTKMQDMLRDWAERHGVMFLDMMEDARRFKLAPPDEPLFFPLDQHFTEAGNRMAAEAICRGLEARCFGSSEERAQRPVEGAAAP